MERNFPLLGKVLLFKVSIDGGCWKCRRSPRSNVTQEWERVPGKTRYPLKVPKVGGCKQAELPPSAWSSALTKVSKYSPSLCAVLLTFFQMLDLQSCLLADGK